MSEHLNDQPLSGKAQHWAAQAVHPNAVVVSFEPLKGGISSLVYRITLRVDGEERQVVLRQFNNADWLSHEPDLALHEADSLRRAATVGVVPTPKLIAFDKSGEQSGMPSVLMSCLDGQVVLQPTNKADWVDGMAKAISHVHMAQVDDYAWTYFPYADASTLDTSSWSSAPEKWREAAAIVAGNRPAFPRRFIHRDYHPANVLWAGGEVSGVVDWVNGCIGPAGIDVGHCRVNLAQLHDVETADAFLAAYRRHAGPAFEYDPYWDLITLIDFSYWPPDVYGGWTALGVQRLSQPIIRDRLDRYLLSLLAKIG
ncbi:MAG: aminoglycoside phosphotransferase [Paenibacillus sp.]|jgi:aminoglycoside phosphotransferase (APT) family kinase protein|nr:aminoglycoside phosphotransferase [Paenibacillus sp.]